MTVRVRYFASLVDRTGVESEQIDAREGDDVRALWDRLVGRHPELATLGFTPLVACDLEYAEWASKLDGVEEVAFLPPVSGG